MPSFACWGTYDMRDVFPSARDVNDEVNMHRRGSFIGFSCRWIPAASVREKQNTSREVTNQLPPCCTVHYLMASLQMKWTGLSMPTLILTALRVPLWTQSWPWKLSATNLAQVGERGNQQYSASKFVTCFWFTLRTTHGPYHTSRNFARLSPPPSWYMLVSLFRRATKGRHLFAIRICTELIGSHIGSEDDWRWPAYHGTCLGDAIKYTAEAAKEAKDNSTRPSPPDRQVHGRERLVMLRSRTTRTKANDEKLCKCQPQRRMVDGILSSE